MKHCLVLTIAFLFFFGHTQAQDHSLARFYNAHRGTATTFKFGVGRFTMRFANWMIPARAVNTDGANVKRIIASIHRIKIYAMEGYTDVPLATKDLGELKQRLIEKDGFEALMEVRDKGSIVQVMNKGKDDELGNVVMLIQDDNAVVIVHLNTSLKIDDINMLIEQFNKHEEKKKNVTAEEGATAGV